MYAIHEKLFLIYNFLNNDAEICSSIMEIYVHVYTSEKYICYSC